MIRVEYLDPWVIFSVRENGVAWATLFSVISNDEDLDVSCIRQPDGSYRIKARHLTPGATSVKAEEVQRWITSVYEQHPEVAVEFYDSREP